VDARCTKERQEDFGQMRIRLRIAASGERGIVADDVVAEVQSIQHELDEAVVAARGRHSRPIASYSIAAPRPATSTCRATSGSR
jgi:hypothetical protein